MKFNNKLILSAAAAMILLTGSARADTFTFSYLFSDSNFAPGKFEGTLSGNQVGDSLTGYVTDITVLTLFVTAYDPVNGSILVDAAPISGPYYILSGDESSVTDLGPYGSAVVSFDQYQNNFVFSRDDILSPSWDPDAAAYVYLMNAIGSGNSGGWMLLDVPVADAFDLGDGKWELINTSRVPEDGATFALFGLTLLGFAAIRRQQSAR